MSKIALLNLKGEKLKDITLNDEVWQIEPNVAVLHNAIILAQASLRQGTHKTKTRSEVSGGGRKPWKQKGTGRARQGSIRSPQWRGGGIAFGPTPRSYAYRLNRKVRRLAVRSVLSEKFIENAIVVVDQIKFDAPKTKSFLNVYSALNLNRKTLFVFDSNEDWDNAYLSMRNIPDAIFTTVEGLNMFDMMRATKIVFTEAAVKTAGEVLA